MKSKVTQPMSELYRVIFSTEQILTEIINAPESLFWNYSLLIWLMLKSIKISKMREFKLHKVKLFLHLQLRCILNHVS